MPSSLLQLLTASPCCLLPLQVVMCEWTEPVFPGGHWTPQLVHIAGASHPLNPAR